MRDIKLGLVCLTAGKIKNPISFKTITKSRFDKLSQSEQVAKLHEIYSANLKTLANAIALCVEQNIPMYRMSSQMFPFADVEMGQNILFDYAEQFDAIGETIRANGLRVVMHPDQFCVLSNPDNPTILENTVRILEHHADVMDLLGLPQSTYAALNIHGGGKYSPERFEALVGNINNLSPRVRDRLTLENCESGWSTDQLVEVYKLTGVPVLFDVHHASVYEIRSNRPGKTPRRTKKVVAAEQKNCVNAGLQVFKWMNAGVSSDSLFEMTLISGEMLSAAVSEVALEAIATERYESPELRRQFLLARTTWKNVDHQLTHVSNGKGEDGGVEFGTAAHSDYIEEFPSFFLEYCVDCEVEAKAKQLAVIALYNLLN